MVLMGVMLVVYWERTGVSVCVFMRITHNPAFVIQHSVTQIKDQLHVISSLTRAERWACKNHWLISDQRCCVQTASLLTQTDADTQDAFVTAVKNKHAPLMRSPLKCLRRRGKGGGGTKDGGRKKHWKDEIKESVNVPTRRSASPEKKRRRTCDIFIFFNLLVAV